MRSVKTVSSVLAMDWKGAHWPSTETGAASDNSLKSTRMSLRTRRKHALIILSETNHAENSLAHIVTGKRSRRANHSSSEQLKSGRDYSDKTEGYEKTKKSIKCSGDEIYHSIELENEVSKSIGINTTQEDNEERANNNILVGHSDGQSSIEDSYSVFSSAKIKVNTEDIIAGNEAIYLAAVEGNSSSIIDASKNDEARENSVGISYGHQSKRESNNCLDIRETEKETEGIEERVHSADFNNFTKRLSHKKNMMEEIQDELEEEFFDGVNDCVAVFNRSYEDPVQSEKSSQKVAGGAPCNFDIDAEVTEKTNNSFKNNGNILVSEKADFCLSNVYAAADKCNGISPVSELPAMSTLGFRSCDSPGFLPGADGSLLEQDYRDMHIGEQYKNLPSVPVKIITYHVSKTQKSSKILFQGMGKNVLSSEAERGNGLCSKVFQANPLNAKLNTNGNIFPATAESDVLNSREASDGKSAFSSEALAAPNAICAAHIEERILRKHRKQLQKNYQCIIWEDALLEDGTKRKVWYRTDLHMFFTLLQGGSRQSSKTQRTFSARCLGYSDAKNMALSCTVETIKNAPNIRQVRPTKFGKEQTLVNRIQDESSSIVGNVENHLKYRGCSAYIEKISTVQKKQNSRSLAFKQLNKPQLNSTAEWDFEDVRGDLAPILRCIVPIREEYNNDNYLNEIQTNSVEFVGASKRYLHGSRCTMPYFPSNEIAQRKRLLRFCSWSGVNNTPLLDDVLFGQQDLCLRCMSKQGYTSVLGEPLKFRHLTCQCKHVEAINPENKPPGNMDYVHDTLKQRSWNRAPSTSFESGSGGCIIWS